LGSFFEVIKKPDVMELNGPRIRIQRPSQKHIIRLVWLLEAIFHFFSFFIFFHFSFFFVAVLLFIIQITKIYNNNKIFKCLMVLDLYDSLLPTHRSISFYICQDNFGFVLRLVLYVDVHTV